MTDDFKPSEERVREQARALDLGGDSLERPERAGPDVVQRIERDLEVWLVRLDHGRDYWDHDRLGRAILLLRSPGGPSEATHEPAGHALALNAPRRCLAREHGREQESVHPGNETRVARHRHAHPSLRNRCGRRVSLSGHKLRHWHCTAVAARFETHCPRSVDMTRPLGGTSGQRPARRRIRRVDQADIDILDAELRSACRSQSQERR